MPQPGQETKPPTELRLRISADLRARIEGSAARDTFNVPSTFTAKAARTSSAVTSSTAPTRPRPALLTRTSIRPNTVVATARHPKTIETAFGKHDRLLTLKLDVTSEQPRDVADLRRTVMT